MQPEPLHLHAYGTVITPTFIDVTLTFNPNMDGITPPTLDGVSLSLRSYTWHQADPYQAFPDHDEKPSLKRPFTATTELAVDCPQISRARHVDPGLEDKSPGNSSAEFYSSTLQLPLHRKCDLQIPACRECTDRRIPCHGYGPKPAWMDGSAAEHQELERIKKAVKQYLKKLRRGVTELSSPSLPERALHHGYDNSEAPETLVDAESSLPLTCSSIQESRAAQHVSPSQTPTPPYVLSPRFASLIMYYLDHVFVWQFPYYQFKSSLGNRGWLLTCLSNGGSLSHAALALSTLHRDASQKRCTYNQEAFEFQSMALRELRNLSQHTEAETLLNDRAKLAEFIAASLTLISFEVFNGAEYDWVPHLDAVTAVLAMHSPDALLRTSSLSENDLPSPINTSRDENSELQADFNFLVAEALWHDILACATTGRVPRIPYRQWLEGSDLAMADLMGCYDWVMIAIGDLAHLNAWKKDMKQKGTLSVPELVKRGQGIEKKLQDDIAELKRTTKASPNSIIRLHHDITNDKD
ncbi:C6 zink-finger PRO1A [Fusarium acutatum]|uniref:C6 zink-finger PRO1A n=1 Tax=Fusarium acutatum TaxID=78861 RepID=A0A8H4JYT0_9HYPO|nr:C6 zink-finger PRO1A [Fusarium acutatum]